MTDKKRLWMRLDNAAKLYPAVRTKNWSNVFRLSATLTELIDPAFLQSALESTIKRFPSVAMRLRHGFFWYYLEEIPKAPQVIYERPYPCSKMSGKDIKTCAFRVLYYENRIAVEFFHSLTDGNGGLVFIKTLAAEYIKQKSGVEIPSVNGVFNRLEKPDQRELEDSFLKHHGAASGSRREKTAYKIRGTKTNGFHYLTTGIISLNDVLAESKKRHVSLTAFIVSVMIFSIMQMQDHDIPDKRKQKPIKILIPVNLRKYFDSISMRNFVLYITPGIEANLREFTFDEIVEAIHHQMKLQLTEKQMRTRITANVRAEKNKLLKVLPLFLKNIGMKIMFSLVGEKKSCITMSNLGVVTVPQEMEPFVSRFDFTLGVQSTGCNNCGILSYKDKLYINLIRNIEESQLERLFFTNLVKMGIGVTVESNQKGKVT